MRHARFTTYGNDCVFYRYRIIMLKNSVAMLSFVTLLVISIYYPAVLVSLALERSFGVKTI